MPGHNPHRRDGDRGSFRADRRGQAIQVGAVLLLAAFVISIASYQAFVVPQENREVEFDHSKRVADQLSELRSDLLATGLDGTNRATTVQLGVGYPNRLLAINPSPAVGSLQTIGTTDTAINVSVLNASTGGETGDFWNGTTHNLTTGALVYEPGYNRYRSAPSLVYENSVLYASRDRGSATLSGQRLVRDDRITLVTLNGSLGASRSGALTVDHQPASAAVRTVEIEAADADSNVTVTVPTLLSADRWDELLATERVGAGGHVTEVAVESVPNRRFNRLRVELATGTDYDLRLGRVGVGSGVQTPGPSYLTNVSATPTAFEAETARVVFEVRDRFDNPVSGVRVRAATERGDSGLESANATSDADGRVAFAYEAPDDLGSDGTDTVDVSFAVDPAVGSFDATTAVNASVPVTLRTVGGADVPYEVRWQDPSGQPGVDQPCSAEQCVIDGSESETVTLTMETDPSVGDADVGYAVNDTTVGTVQRTTGVTDANGRNQTVLEVDRNGALRVYTWSGAAGDGIELSVTGFNGFEGVDTTSILPYGNSQAQQIAFTPNADIPSGESVTIDLSAAQQSSPRQVEYGSAGASVSQGGGSAGFNAQNADDATVVYTPPSGGLAEGQTAVVRITGIRAGTPSNQNGPYSVPIDRSDGNTVTSTFDVAFETGTSELRSVSASDLNQGEDDATQTLSFTPDTALEGDELVTIDLSDPQDGTGGGQQVDYTGGGASVTGGSPGSVNVNQQNSNNVTLNYVTPDSGVSAGTSITVEFTGVETGSGNGARGTYTVGFSREDADTRRARFDVTNPGGGGGPPGGGGGPPGGGGGPP